MKFTANKSFHFPLFITIIVIVFTGCKEDSPFPEYKKHKEGYYSRLLGFQEDVKRKKNQEFVYLSATFSNQRDSIFWSSSVEFSEKFILQLFQQEENFLIENHLSISSLGDSTSLFVPALPFFQRYFYSKELPRFMKTDSLVKVNYKILAFLDQNELDSLKFDWEAHEDKLMTKYAYKINKENCLKDDSRVYWLEGGPDPENPSGTNKSVTVAYKGYLLSNKQFDESPPGFEINTSVPDQCLPGINYVIKRMKSGESAKIILPSYLAFGEDGLGNIVPPCSPIVYEITLLN
ncbi:MAG: FKBP-type peptidyl-prolyl cis-trans isomerase [Flavobacteriales bacterium]|nr:FKBP-type peptidyl-prolyl cis-trans isomerase [Flavobacteriales bacterium]